MDARYPDEKMKFYKKFSQIRLNDFEKVRFLFKDRPHTISMDYSNPDIKEYLNALSIKENHV